MVKCWLHALQRQVCSTSKSALAWQTCRPWTGARYTRTSSLSVTSKHAASFPMLYLRHLQAVHLGGLLTFPWLTQAGMLSRLLMCSSSL